MRLKTEIQADYEEIVSYEWHSAGFVKVLIGYGSIDDDNNFKLNSGMPFESILIQGHDYIDLMAEDGIKPANMFRKDDLWPRIDSIRARPKNV